jgi:hypothetical protein
MTSTLSARQRQLLTRLNLTPDHFLPLLEPSMRIFNFGLNPIAAELMWAINELHRAHETRGNIAEIGVAHGASALFLYQLRRPGEALYLNDLFGEAGLDVSESGDHQSTVESVKRTFAGAFGTADEAVFIRKPSGSLTPDDMHHVRLFHVDGGHSYEEAVADLGYAMDVLHPQGAIVVDDMTTDTGWRAVYYATLDFVRSRDLDKQFFVPHFTNKAVIVPDRDRFDELYSLYRDASCQSAADRRRQFNLSDVSFEPYWQQPVFMQVLAPLRLRVAGKLRRMVKRQ